MRTSDTSSIVTVRHWARLAMAGAVLGGVTLLTAACGGTTASGGPATSSPGSGPASGTNAAAGPSSTTSSGTQVTATLTEYHIALSTETFKPGTYMFVARNAGQVGHALEIDGPGLSGARTQGGIAPGQSADLKVTLRDGTYDVFCPVPGHKALGMDTKITVSGNGSGGAVPPPATSAPMATTGGGGSGSGYGNGY